MFQLVYLWVEKFRTLENIGINFHPAFEFEFKKDPNNENSGILELKKFDESKLEDDYFPDNQFISVIVGKNGTGKSSILDLLNSKSDDMYALIGKIKNVTTNEIMFILFTLNTRFLLIFNINKQLFIWGAKTNKNINFIDFNNYLSINNKYIIKLSLPPRSIDNIKEKNRYIENCFSSAKKLKIIFFKNLIKIISRKEKKIFIENLIKCGNLKIFIDIFNLTNDKYVKLPENIQVNINIKRFIINKENGYLENITPLRNKEILKSSHFKEFLYNLNFKSLNLKDKVILLLFFYLLFSGELKEDVIKKYIEIKNINITNIKIFIEKYIKNLNEIFDLVEFLNKLNRENLIHIKVYNEISMEIYFNLLQKSKSNLEKLTSLFEKVLKVKNIYRYFIDFDFSPPLSSGQLILLSLFSQISRKLDKNICKNIYKKENILLLLDEPDVYLHPEWQRLFVYFLTEFLKRKYPNKHFHIILTTHSPFLLSDIPKENVIFLDLDDNYKTIVKPKDEISDTLAQNIYYLLSDGFFMEKGIGEYISQKLKEFLEKINNGSLTGDEEKKFERLINRIGDKALKHKLEHILNNKEFYKEKFFENERN